MNRGQGEVKRILVMMDYGPDHPHSGEVFDVTQLATELFAKAEKQQIQIDLKVSANPDYTKEQVNGKYPQKLRALWRLMADYEYGPESAILDDAVNAAMPDSIAVQELRKTLDKIHAKAAKINEDIQTQKLRDAAAVRSKYPIARVTAPGLAQVVAPEQLPAP